MLKPPYMLKLLLQSRGGWNFRLQAHWPDPRRAIAATLLGALAAGLLFAPAGVTLAAKQKAPIQYQIPIPPPPDFSALSWLMGDWTGKTVLNSPPGQVQLSVSPGLDKRFLLFHAELALAATRTIPAFKESWMGILSASPDGTGFILHVFSTTGFITRYGLSINGPELHWTPEGGESPPPGWLFRKSWTRIGADQFSETVQAAPPGKGFFDYYTAIFTHVPAATKAAPAP